MQKRYDAGEVITAMITPFDKDLKVDFNKVEKLAKHLSDNGSDAVLVVGTTGESPTLTHEEELDILRAVKNALRGTSTKIIMNTGSNSTLTAVEMSKKVEKTGMADALLSVVPYYNKPSQEGLVNHFSMIADSTSLPIILYNIPGRTGINMLPDTIAKLVEKNKNISGVKQSCADLDLVSEIRIKTPDDFAIYSGDDSLTLPMLALGADGVISVASHVIGKEIKEMISSFKSGNYQKALELHKKYFDVFKKLFIAPNPTPVKAVLAAKGLIEEFVRPPLCPVTDSQRDLLKKLDI